MPRPPSAIPDFIPPLHLYRHLLREASYLPPSWRDTVTSTIRTRFRRHRKDVPRTKYRLATAHNTVRSLRAANSGDRTVMERLIWKGFGRRGPKRRVLNQSFLSAQGPNDSSALASLLDGDMSRKATDIINSKIAANPKTKKEPFFEKWDTEKLKLLFRSQKKAQSQSPISWLNRELKGLDETVLVPKKNFWGKPPAESLVRSKTGKWWKRQVEKLMPPLNQGEWDLLHRLSEGEQELDEWKIPERRTLAKPILNHPEVKTMDWNWEAHASKPSAMAERATSRAEVRRSGQTSTGPYQPRKRDTELSGRWFRRTYNRTWQMTPVAQEDQRSLKHSFTWGSAKSGVASPTKAQLDIFEGVNSKGEVPKQSANS